MWKNLRARFDSTDSLVSLALGLAVVLVIGLTIINYIRTRTDTATSTSKQEEAAQMGTPSLPAKHVVKAGETLWSISETYFKSGYNWVDIQKANNLVNADMIEEGTTLSIPAATPILAQGQVSSAATSMKPKSSSYTVVAGDDLWDIAVSQYGDGYRWVDIAKANSLDNPDVIHAGNVLKMP